MSVVTMVTAPLNDHTPQEMLTSLTDNSFSQHVKALEVRKLEKPKKLSVENSKYLSEIESHQFEFDRGRQAML